MELLNENELQVIVDRIMRQTILDGECILWRPSRSGRPGKKGPTDSHPSLRMGPTNDTRVSCLSILWQHHHKEVKPFKLDHVCRHGVKCLNVNHKTRATRKPRQQRPRRTYARHTSECPGPDPVLIERLATAGTLEVISPDHVLCDCERAWLINNTDFPLRDLNMSGATANRIRGNNN